MPRPIERGGAADALRRASGSVGRSALQLDETVSPSWDLVDLSKSPWSVRNLAVPAIAVDLQAPEVGEVAVIALMFSTDQTRDVFEPLAVTVDAPAGGALLIRVPRDTVTGIPAQFAKIRSANSQGAEFLPLALLSGSVVSLSPILDVWGRFPASTVTRIDLLEGCALPANQALIVAASAIDETIVATFQARYYADLAESQP